MLTAALAYVRREPVRTAAFVIAAVIVTVSLITGTPVSAILVYLAGAAASLEVARAAVGRLITEALHTPVPGSEPLDAQVGSERTETETDAGTEWLLGDGLPPFED